MIRINADTQWQELQAIAAKSEDGFGAFPRESKYGSAPGLVPYGEAYADTLVAPADYKEVIHHCHAQKIFPMYHQANTWMPKGSKWNQNGLPYCWAWGMTAAVMDCQAVEGKRDATTELLAPVSLGHCVGWKKKGNYLESAIKGVVERGIAPASFIPDPHSRSYKDYLPGWEDAALLNRIPADSVWDTDPDNMLQHAVSILRTGRSLYIAYNWWGHALSCVGLLWDESEPNNVVWVIRNSHNEDDFILLTGRKGVPSEAFGIHATLNAA